MEKAVVVEVEMQAFMGGAIRNVKVPAGRAIPSDVYDLLDAVFYYGQNDFQPVAGMPSVSVGDVIRWAGKRYAVRGMGFEEVV